jgi:signal transduction histidine kinase
MKLLNTFYGRLAALFLGLVVVLGLGTYALVAPAFVSFLCETEQRVNYHLAADMATDLEPLLHEGIDHEALRSRIAYLTGINPKVDIYLLDADGAIRAYFAQSATQPTLASVDTAPIQTFLAGGSLPIWGQDPFFPGQRRPFSVAPIAVMGYPDHYLYVIVGSERYYTVAGALQQSYIMQGSMRGIGLILLFAIGTGLFSFALVTRRLRTVNDAVARFTKGEFEARVRDASPDEIGQLAAAFNRMADTIAANVKELEQTDRLRRELIANVSHDLRSPLASIQGYLETIQIKDESLTPSERQSHISVALRNARRLNRLVSELFELSKLEARQVAPQFEAFSVAELVQDLVMQFRPQAEAANIRLEAVLPERPSLVYADIALVERALGNLIENALRHTAAGGCVRVVSADEAEQVRIEVCDTGVGIPEKDLPHVFDRFYRIENGRGNGSGGLGLGLAIAQKIAELHGTRLSVTSKADCGTRFTFALPIATAA